MQRAVSRERLNTLISQMPALPARRTRASETARCPCRQTRLMQRAVSRERLNTRLNTRFNTRSKYAHGIGHLLARERCDVALRLYGVVFPEHP